MFTGYNLVLPNTGLGSYLQIGEESYNRGGMVVKKVLSSFLDEDGGINAKKLQKSWFPEIKASIFISHAHQDKPKALNLAGWLWSEFRITSFIDSCVWGHADDLLKRIDNKYCLNDDKKTYSYESRNKSTSHVHMILSIALAMMLDKTECLFFLNTPASIAASDVIYGNTTPSPWIYAEIALSYLIRRKPLRDHRAQENQELLKYATALDEALNVNYKLNLSHLTDLSSSDLKSWNTQCTEANATEIKALDILYKFKP